MFNLLSDVLKWIRDLVRRDAIEVLVRDPNGERLVCELIGPNNGRRITDNRGSALVPRGWLRRDVDIVYQGKIIGRQALIMGNGHTCCYITIFVGES